MTVDHGAAMVAGAVDSGGLVRHPSCEPEGTSTVDGEESRVVLPMPHARSSESLLLEFERRTSHHDFHRSAKQ